MAQDDPKLARLKTALTAAAPARSQPLTLCIFTVVVVKKNAHDPGKMLRKIAF